MDLTTNPAHVAVYDELPLWAAPFGLALLDRVRLGRGLRALDVGCGTGFPLIELAERLGPRATVVGVDPWQLACERVEEKCRIYGVENVSVVCAPAERLPFEDGWFDLLVSNNGLNNVADPAVVLAECHRTSRRGAQLVMTWNLPGSMAEFYAVFEELLGSHGRTQAIAGLHRHIHVKRKTVAYFTELLVQAGFVVDDVTEHVFRMRFADGTSMLRHHFVRLAFLDAWREVAAVGGEADVVLEQVRVALDDTARAAGELVLTIPFACLDARRT